MLTLEKESESESNWIKNELSNVSLGDKRLNWRLQDTAGKLASRPNVSINQACDDWADTKASYRLFDNKKRVPKRSWVSTKHERKSEWWDRSLC